jgi:ElaB/YqjD/DUF883 family membrane-anchored ribosome-binding protein
MAASEAKPDRTDESSAHEQLRELREQVETLMRERVRPVLAEAAEQAQDAAREVRDMAREKSDALANCVREKPLTTVLLAVAAGYLLGRFTR